jgi:hypothetical protein
MNVEAMFPLRQTFYRTYDATFTIWCLRIRKCIEKLQKFSTFLIESREFAKNGMLCLMAGI